MHFNWKEMEKKLLGFGEANGSTFREMVFQRYDFLRVGVWKLSLDPQPHEKANLALLKGSLTRMEKQLWPNLMTRFFVRLKAELFERPVQQKQFKMMKDENWLLLSKFMNERGFGTLVSDLEKELDHVRNCFGMKMSGELEGGKRIELELEMACDLCGRYHPTLIGATLTGSDGQKLTHDFLLSDPLDVPMVVNLMQGRAVCVLEKDGKSSEVEKWLQVQFDKGDSYLRNFNVDYGFSAEQLLRDIAVQFGMPSLSDERLVEEMKKGNQIGFIAGAPLNKKLLLEADPSLKSLTLRNELGEKLDIQILMEQKKAYEVKMSEGLPEIKMDRNIGKVNGQERGIG